jgi:hypothetical protein
MTGAISKPTAVAVAAATVVAICLFAASSVASAAGTFSVRPGQSDPADPATRAYFKPAIKAGASASQSVVVSNTGTSVVRLVVYAVDGLTGVTTGTVYANRQDRVRKAGAWVKPSVSRVTLQAGQTTSVAFTIRVPKGALAGDHVAGIAFEDADPTTSGGRFRIKEIIREIVGIQIRVPGKASPRLALGGLRLKNLPGTKVASVVVGVGNRGLTLCKPLLAVSLRGPKGYRRSVARPLDTVLPGDMVAYPLPWPGTLRNGKYAARTKASCQGRGVTRRTAVTLGKAIGPGANGKRKRAASFAGIPLWVLALVGLGGVGGGVALGRLRPRRATHIVPAPAAAGLTDHSSPAGPVPDPHDERP